MITCFVNFGSDAKKQAMMTLPEPRGKTPFPIMFVGLSFKVAVVVILCLFLN